MSKQSDLSATNAGIWTRRCVPAITVSRMSNAVLSQIHIKSRKYIDIMTKIIKTVSVWLPVILLVAVLTAAPTAAQGSGSVEQHQAEAAFKDVLQQIPDIGTLLEGTAADTTNFVVSLIEAPWAFDALGNKIPSEYTIQGDTLVLNVAHDMAAAYPVVADPVWTWGIVSGTAYFSRDETVMVAGSIATLAPLLILIPPPFNLAIAGYAVTIYGWAVSALFWWNKCLKVKYGFSWSWSGPSPGIYPGHYYC